MRIGITCATLPLTHGVQHSLAQGLAAALVGAGHRVETMHLPFDPAADPLPQAVAMRLLHVADPFDRLIALGPPAHWLLHPRKVAWLSCHPGYDPAGILREDDGAVLGGCRLLATSAAAASRWSGRGGMDVMTLGAPAVTRAAEGPVRFTALVVAPAPIPVLAAALVRARPDVRVLVAGSWPDAASAMAARLATAGLAPGRLVIDPSPVTSLAWGACRCFLDLGRDDDQVSPDQAAIHGRSTLDVLDDPAALAAGLDAVEADPAGMAERGRRAAAELLHRPSWADVTTVLLA